MKGLRDGGRRSARCWRKQTGRATPAETRLLPRRQAQRAQPSARYGLWGTKQLQNWRFVINHFAFLIKPSNNVAMETKQKLFYSTSFYATPIQQKLNRVLSEKELLQGVVSKYNKTVTCLQKCHILTFHSISSFFFCAAYETFCILCEDGSCVYDNNKTKPNNDKWAYLVCVCFIPIIYSRKIIFIIMWLRFDDFYWKWWSAWLDKLLVIIWDWRKTKAFWL